MDIGTIILVVFCCIALVVLATAVMGITLYNALARLKVLTEEAWSGIDVQLKKRYDLIPNLVSTVKGYASHEEQLLEKVTQLRASTVNGGSIEQKMNAETELSGVLKTLFSVSENYPELKADKNFLDLQRQLEAIENDLSSARRYYNGTVREFNSKLVVFPNNIFAKFLHYSAQPFFEATESEKENVKVNFDEPKA